MLLFLIGVICGVGIILFSAYIYVAYFAEKPYTQEEIDKEIQGLVDKHTNQIEIAALERLRVAMDQAQRTGQPVKVELGGVEEYIYVSPPPGIKKEKLN